MQWFAEAPSNIALIKYMGKTDHLSNLPMNASLSYTLPHLLSYVSLKTIPGAVDLWEPLSLASRPLLALSPKAQSRFLKQLQNIKDQFNYQGSFLVQSANDFPHGAGIASSASSFAALTRCASMALSELTGVELPSVTKQAEWSRMGSGSSCRSFFAPWSFWDTTGASAIHFPRYERLHHEVIVMDATEKQVSSSEAHLRIQSSPYYSTRADEANAHLAALIKSLQDGSWSTTYAICAQEFKDMHRLFATASPSFSYMTSSTQDLLSKIDTWWEREGDGPLVTMDAGATIHLLYRLDQMDMAAKFKRLHIEGKYRVLSA